MASKSMLAENVANPIETLAETAEAGRRRLSLAPVLRGVSSLIRTAIGGGDLVRHVAPGARPLERHEFENPDLHTHRIYGSWL